MPKLKPDTHINTPEEDAALTAAAMSDPENPIITEAEMAHARPLSRRPGRPHAAVTKKNVTIRLSPDVVDRFRASGRGWQTRIETVLKDWLKDHNPAA